ncbi:hypothetical protein C1645_836540, partial [Glomus cerebriforme]
MDFVKIFFHFNKHQKCKQLNTGIGWCDKCFTKQIGQEYLSDDVFEQIKYFIYCDLTEEQKLLIDKLILNEELKEHYKKYGLCRKCKQPKTDDYWCNLCNAKQFQQNFKNWTS